MKKKLAALYFVIFLTVDTNLFAQNDLEAPFDPSVKTGILKNGMKYFIKHNEEPKERCSFYFAQNVGSVLEQESQRGLAHFLEHMAFNGTQHYEGKGILEYLEKNGVRFGSEINAYTSFDQTVYNISKVPTSNEHLLDSVLLVLHDWSGYLSLTDEEIDNERGVINEEWRTRNTPGFRASEKVWTQGFLKGSDYEKRMPIGLMSVVNNFEYDELRDYYSQWYRPDQQAVVIVGDIDTDRMEKKVIATFSNIPLRPDLPARNSFDVPRQKELIFIEALDKELGDTNIEYYTKNEGTHLKGKPYLDNSLIAGITGYILNNRFREFTIDEECPALSVYYSNFNFVRPLDILSLNIQPRPGRIKESFEFALTELTRFAKYGATDGELERAKASFKSNYISSLKNKDKISSESYARDLYQHFFTGQPFNDITWKYQYLLNKIPAINNDDLLNYLAANYNWENNVLAIKGTDASGYPNQQELSSVINKVKNKELEVYKEIINDKPLISESLSGSTVKRKYTIDGIQANGYELSNGARVIIYPTAHDQDKIYMRAFSQGGSSLLDKELLPSAQLATYVASESGLGPLNKIELNKKLAGTNTSLGLSINEISETLNGYSTKTDIKVLFEKIYLSFMSPRFDEKALNLTMERMKKNLKDKEKNKKRIFQDSMRVASTNHHERTILFDDELLHNISLEDIQQVYTDRFNNANDFTFVFVGDIEEDELLQLSLEYIGSISYEQNTEEYLDHNLEPASGKTIMSIEEVMETPQTTVNFIFKGDLTYNSRNDILMNVVGQLLSKRYLEVIREQEGGSYGVGAWGNMENKPRERYTVGINFDCNPEKADKLMAVVYEEMQKLTESVDGAELREVKESFMKRRREAVNTNSFWLNVISNHLEDGTEIIPLDDYIKLVSSISEEEVSKVAKVIVNHSDIVEGVMNPLLVE